MNQSQRNMATQVDEQEIVDPDNLESIQDRCCLLSRIFFLHHIALAYRYLCSLDSKHILKYSKSFQPMLQATKLKDIAIQNNKLDKKFYPIFEIFKLQKASILIAFVLSILVGIGSVIPIYYQNTLIKNIIDQRSGQQYKWFGIIVGVLIFRLLVFNYLMGIVTNLAINVKVSLQNLFMRAIFFIEYNSNEIRLQQLKYLQIDGIVEGIIMFPYLLICFFICSGIVVCVYLLNSQYSYIVFTAYMISLFLQTIIMIYVYYRLKKSSGIKQQLMQQNRWVYQKAIFMIFEAISNKIRQKTISNRQNLLKQNAFFNSSYVLSQFLSDCVIVVSTIAYYYLASDKTITRTSAYFIAVYLGMMYYPYKIFVYSSFILVKSFHKYYQIKACFKSINRKKFLDPYDGINQIQRHTHADYLGCCFDYNYNMTQIQFTKKKQSIKAVNEHKLKKMVSNTFIQLSPQNGQVIMVYCNVAASQKGQKYVNQFLHERPANSTIAIVYNKTFILPETLKQNVLFYSPFEIKKYNEIIQLLELQKAQILFARNNSKLNYRMAKFYQWHQTRLQLARALYNGVDYLVISKQILIEDSVLVKKLCEYRKKQNKITILVNNWNLEMFEISSKIIIMMDDKKQIGQYANLLKNEESLMNRIIKQANQSKQKKDEIYKLSREFRQNMYQIMKIEQPKIQLKRSIYFTFFSYAHTGGFIVILLALLSPIAFKTYLSYLIGQSTKNLVNKDYLIFGLIYLFLILIKGFVLSIYVNVASIGLYKKISDNSQKLRGNQVLSILQATDETISDNFSQIDQNLVTSFQIGQTVIFQGVVGLIMLGIGQPIVLAVTLPLIVVTLINNTLYNRTYKKLNLFREKYQSQVKTFISFCTSKSKEISNYGKFKEVQKKYHELHKWNVIFSCNQMWMLSGFRVLGQFLVLIAVVIFLIVMIQTQGNDTTKIAFVSLGVSLYLNMSFSYRFNIKTVATLQSQLMAITKAINFEKVVSNAVIKETQDAQSDSQKIIQITEFKSIQFKDVNISYGNSKIHDINLTLKKGDRIAVSYDSKYLVHIPFYLLKRSIFGDQFIDGDIIIDDKIKNTFKIDGLFFLHSKSMMPDIIENKTVFDACKLWKSQLQKQQCQRQLAQFFTKVGLPQIFTIESKLVSLNQAFKQILSLFRIVNLQKCKILVMISGLSHIDILTRIKLEEYIKSIKQIQIVISITNIMEIINIYDRHLIFENETFKETQAQIQ